MMIRAHGRKAIIIDSDIEPIPPTLLNTDYHVPGGPTISVPSGGNLQAALDAATGGSTILLEPAGTYVGNFGLPARDGADNPVHVRTAGDLPPEGVRVTPASATGFAKIITPNVAPALVNVGRSRGWRFIGVEVTLDPALTVNYGLIAIGQAEIVEDELCGFVTMDRSYVHGAPNGHIKAGVQLNGVSTAVIDSHLSECHSANQDAQAAGGWNGPGPQKLVNNHLEGSGENVMFGGASPKIVDLSPSDIEIRRNYFVKPMEWRNRGYVSKNLFEIKHAKRVLVADNVFKNNWGGGQAGFALVLYSGDDNASAPWTACEDVLLRDNWIESSGSGIALSSDYAEGPGKCGPTARIAFRNNVMVDIGRPDLNGEGKMINLLGMYAGLQGVTFDHNTMLTSLVPGAWSNWAIGFDGAKGRLVFTNNLISNGTYGLFSSYGNGAAALNGSMSEWQFEGNALVDGQAAGYPAGNFFPTLAALGLDASYRITAPGLLGTDGKKIGANIDAVLQAIAGVRP